MDAFAAAFNAPPERFNFARHLFELNAARAGKPAYVDETGSLAYGELEDRSRRVASALAALGLRREERVLLFMLDGLDWPVAFLGALYAGVVPVCVNTLLPAGDVAYMLGHSRAQAAFTSGALLPTLQAAMAQAPHEAKALVVSRAAGALPPGALAFDALLDHPGAARPADTLADDIAFWLYSSGSTGRPKGTVHSHANPYWTVETYAKRVLQLREDDVVFSAAKLFFAYGLGNALSFPLAAGATTVLMAERPTPAAVFERLARHRPTVFYGVPTLYAAMLAAPNAPGRDRSTLRIATSAGEALPKEIGERFAERFGCDVLDGIGSTEMLHIFLSNAPGDVHYGTSGRPVPGYAIELRGESSDGRSGAPVADGEIGDLYIRGPSAALMYWGQREQSQATFQGGWTKSGDKYSRDAAGLYTYAGRSDDMLKVSGQYVSPFEVEAALIRHDAVLEAAVIGVPDAEGLMKTKAFVVLKPGHAAGADTEAALKAFVKDLLAPYKYPRRIEFLAELPKTATGKIQRFKLRAREEGREAGA
ncbi:MAG TPA: benzoate-CoA ligase family protein [Methylibium sp.]|uniref:benzoate-CoA ligase family protein n=1 Tax=Methylibium sp. TaxID=2067992 RepID=UPI002DBEF1FE|nr:benzoate-CoA ligase family protein [Methylibium sp.]HEU4457504.1 benzoate-CoA ligase family protein [Methylibium sp.]